MKKLFLFSLILFMSANLFAQADGYKKWVLLEHFTNTRCGICGNANPQFYNRWSAFPDDIHHISYHPSFPYPNCAIHQSNPTENTKRANYYNVGGTPFVLKNGKNGSSAGSTSTSVLSGLVGSTSPLLVQVSETGSTNRTVTVNVTSHPNATLQSGDLKLYVAAVEKTFNYNAPNGEDVHHNVFRTMIVDGIDFTAAGASGIVELTFDYTIDGSWVEGEMYAMAWIQDGTSKDIFNSGSSLDPQFVNSNETYTGSFTIAPNPVKDILNIQFGESLTGTIQIFDIVGKIQKNVDMVSSNLLQVNMVDLIDGIYLMRIQSDKGILTRRIIVKR